MSNTRGIFDNFTNPSAPRQDSPFSVVQDKAADALPPASPFTPVSNQNSPFTVVEEGPGARPPEFGRQAKIPETRKVESPFQVAEPSEGFGFEPPARVFGSSPFEVAPTQVASPFETAAAPINSPFTPASSPFSAPTTPAQAPASPFSSPTPAGPSPTTQAALAAFETWQEPAAPPAAPAAPVQAEIPETAAPTPFAPVVSNPPPSSPFAQQTPAPASAPFSSPSSPSAPAATSPAAKDDSYSDSFSIRQLELRAIFGVDREMTPDEILQRSRALPGMKNLSRVAPADFATIEAMKTILPNLGFGSGALKLYAGSVPLEFIREGPVMLAVQTDGGFAPGVRETLMLVARELGRSQA